MLQKVFMSGHLSWLFPRATVWPEVAQVADKPSLLETEIEVVPLHVAERHDPLPSELVKQVEVPPIVSKLSTSGVL